MRHRFSAAAAAILFSACAIDAEPDTQAIPQDDEFPLSSRDEIFEGAPDSASIPPEVRYRATYPAQYSALVAQQSPVKSQGSRGVCSIFATAALMEHLYIKGNVMPNPDFSEQYLQWSAKVEARTFTRTEGSNNESNLRAVSRFGIVAENDWRYESQPWNTSNDPECDRAQKNLATRCYTNGEPPAEALRATKYKLPASRFVNNTSIKTVLFEQKTAVAIGLDFYYQAWNHRASTLKTNNEAWRKGVVLYPSADDKTESEKTPAGHAVLIVGWDDNLEMPTFDKDGNKILDAAGRPVMQKGFYIFKNSWGTSSFGVENPYGAGYGFISMRYVNEYASSVTSSVPAGQPQPQPGQPRTFTATPNEAIPDSPAPGITSTITVTDTGTLSSLSIATDISHTYRGDLRVTLSKGSTTVTLHDGAGGSAHDLKQTFAPADFNGQSLAGTWTLSVVDTAAQDVGTLNGWTLTLTPTR